MIQCTRCRHKHETRDRHMTPPDNRGLQFSVCPKCGGREYIEMSTKPYRPINGTEGECFQEQFCAHCWKNRNQGCLIAARTMLFDVDEPEYPKQWTYDAQGQPTCTAFLSFDDHKEQVKAMYQPRRAPENQLRLL